MMHITNCQLYSEQSDSDRISDFMCTEVSTSAFLKIRMTADREETVVGAVNTCLGKTHILYIFTGPSVKGVCEFEYSTDILLLFPLHVHNLSVLS